MAEFAKDLKPEVAYLLTQTIVGNKKERVKAHSGFKDFYARRCLETRKIRHPSSPGGRKILPG
jgi:hypothetical protein